MTLSRADLILHPVRFRILRALGVETLTTQEISDRLTDTPTSSIYRHLKLLLDGEMIVVAETRMVNGIAEKQYRVAQRPYLGPDDLNGLTAADHIRFFTSYVLSLIQDFADYAEKTEAESGVIDLVEDGVGYTEIMLHVSKKEFSQLAADLNAAVMKYLQNEPDADRQQIKIALITHPKKEN